jgi:glycine cleavage system regulatory protein
MLHEFEEFYTIHQAGFEIEEEMFHFQNGICVPASCSVNQVEHFTKNLLKETNFITIRTLCQTNQPQLPHQLDDFLM